MALKKSVSREDPQQYVLRKNYKKAVELYRAVLKDSPVDANTWLRLGDCLVLDSQNDAAVTAYKEVARLYADAGFLLKAIAVNKKIVKLDPSQEAVHQQLSDLYQERGLLGAPRSTAPASKATGSIAGSFDFEMEVDPGTALDLDNDRSLERAEADVLANEGLLDLLGSEEGPASETATTDISIDDLGDALADMPVVDPQADDLLADQLPAATEVGRTPLFSDFTADELVEIVKKMTELTLAADTTVVREGDPGDSLFVITSGSVRVVTQARGRELKLADLREGEFFGEGSILTGKPRTATILTNQESEFLVLSRADLDQIQLTHPRVREVMVQFYQNRAESTVQSILGSKK